ncbi:unnamed protein product [Parascedosporium putredinis]|uniref:Uncharacterized protein n=1 Tax=Parascedosporium putredinis TaxID=1442378 RepID=A0A9P1GX14_9PEZI|nr:unnamed protein product [Parascedosporium putredinis]CAI7989347.1 unnamed protein product [Parascedosporium putredinis]
MAFAKHAALAGAAIIRPSSAGSVGSRSENSNLSSASKNTRIPRPATVAPNSTNSRRPITLMEAYRLAEEEEELRGAPYGPDASPSPAPRPWRSRNSSEEAKMRKLLNQDPQDIRGRESKTPDVGRSSIPRRPGSSLSERSSHSSGSSDRRVSSDANKGNLSAKSGLFSKSKVGPNIARTGEALARKASNSSLRSSGSVSPAPRAYRERNSLGREDSVPNFDPLPEIRAVYSYPTPEYEGNASSPNKSYAWQLENDFTAGDLSISESPRIRVDSTGKPRRSRSSRRPPSSTPSPQPVEAREY